MQEIIAEAGFFIQPSKMFVPPCASVMTNGESVCQALSHNPSGFRQPSVVKTCPSYRSQACSMGFSYCYIRSLWQVLRKTVIFIFFMFGVVLCSFGPGKAVV